MKSSKNASKSASGLSVLVAVLVLFSVTSLVATSPANSARDSLKEAWKKSKVPSGGPESLARIHQQKQSPTRQLHHPLSPALSSRSFDSPLRGALTPLPKKVSSSPTHISQRLLYDLFPTLLDESPSSSSSVENNVTSNHHSLSQRQAKLPNSCWVDPETEYEALVTFFLSMSGGTWLNSKGWLNDTNYCTWYGVICLGDLIHILPFEARQMIDFEEYLANNTTQGPVLAISLPKNNLEGSFPDSFFNLTCLVDLHLQYNRITGPINPLFSKLNSLQVLNLFNNKLDGPLLDSTFENMTSLTVLDFQSNLLNGFLPENITINIPTLQEITLDNNFFSGTIPDSLFFTKTLMTLQISHNNLTGSIPETISNATSLEVLNLAQNLLNGSLPVSFSGLHQIQVVRLQNNLLTGNLSSSIGNLFRLVEFSIANNKLSGTIPSSIGQNDVLMAAGRAIVALDFSNNDFTGAVSYEMLHLPALYFLSIRGNKDMHSIPLSEQEDVRYTTDASFYPGGYYCISRDVGYQFLYDPEYYDYDGCICEPNTYGAPKEGCQNCIVPIGNCPGGEAITWREGYFPVLDNPSDPKNATLLGFEFCGNPISRCNTNSDCAFAPTKGFNCTNNCGEGYVGFLCGACEKGFFRRGGQCYECRWQWGYLWIILVVFVLCSLFLLSVVGAVFNAIRYLAEKKLFPSFSFTFTALLLILLLLANAVPVTIVYIFLAIIMAGVASAIWKVIWNNLQKLKICQRMMRKSTVKDRMTRYNKHIAQYENDAGIGLKKALLFFLQLANQLSIQSPSEKGGADFLHISEGLSYIEGPECRWPDLAWMKIEALLVMCLPLLLLLGFIVSSGISYIIVKFIIPRYISWKRRWSDPIQDEVFGSSKKTPLSGKKPLTLTTQSSSSSSSSPGVVTFARRVTYDAIDPNISTLAEERKKPTPKKPKTSVLDSPDVLRHAPEEALKRCATIFLLSTLLIYFQLTLVVFRSWDCQTDPLTGIKYFAFAPDVQCSYDNWYIALTTSFGLVLGVIGFPVLWFTLIALNRNGLNEFDPRPWLGVLYRDYRPPFGWWLSVEAMGYVLIAATTAFCSEGSGCLPFWGTLVLMFFMMLHIYCRPHKLAVVDVAWVSSYCASLILMIWARIGVFSGYSKIASKLVIITMFLFFILMLTPLYKPFNLFLTSISVAIRGNAKRVKPPTNLDGGESEAEGLVDEASDDELFD